MYLNKFVVSNKEIVPNTTTGFWEPAALCSSSFRRQVSKYQEYLMHLSCVFNDELVTLKCAVTVVFPCFPRPHFCISTFTVSWTCIPMQKLDTLQSMP